MSGKMFKGAGVLAAILGLVLILVIYALLGSVDLIYMKDGREVYRQEKVTALKNIDDPNEKMCEEFRTEDGIKFTYTIGDEQKDFNPEDAGDLKIDIVKTLLTNLFTFKWDELDNDILFEAK